MEGGGGRLSNALKMISSKIRWKRNVNGAKKGTKSALDKMKKSVNIAKPNLFSTKFMKKIFNAHTTRPKILLFHDLH